MKFQLDGELPYELMSDEQYVEWLKKDGVRLHTKEEKEKALEEFYNRFPEERPQDYKQNK